MGEQPGVLALPRRVAAPTPRVKPTARDVQHPTQHLHGMGGLLHLDEPISQVDSLAKKAIAFFKMSRSCRTWSSSRRTALSSSVARKPFVPSGILAACRFHRLNVVCPIPSSRATCVQVLPLCRSSSTASCLNSAVNVWRDLPMSHLLLAIMPGRCPQIQGKTKVRSLVKPRMRSPFGSLFQHVVTLFGNLLRIVLEPFFSVASPGVPCPQNFLASAAQVLDRFRPSTIRLFRRLRRRSRGRRWGGT